MGALTGKCHVSWCSITNSFRASARRPFGPFPVSGPIARGAPDAPGRAAPTRETALRAALGVVFPARVIRGQAMLQQRV